METIGKRIKDKRKELGLTLKDVEYHTHLSISSMSDIENDKYMPSVNALMVLTKLLGVTSDWLIFGDDNILDYKEIKDINGFYGVSDRIKSLIQILNIKQSDLCRITGISTNGMSQYITGKRVPDTLSIYKIAKALGVRIEWLLDGTEPVYSSNAYDDLTTLFSKLDNRDKQDILDIMECKIKRAKS